MNRFETVRVTHCKVAHLVVAHSGNVLPTTSVDSRVIEGDMCR
jgi:hypothetical protein